KPVENARRGVCTPGQVFTSIMPGPAMPLSKRSPDALPRQAGDSIRSASSGSNRVRIRRPKSPSDLRAKPYAHRRELLFQFGVELHHALGQLPDTRYAQRTALAE